jgi:hypothetical protein
MKSLILGSSLVLLLLGVGTAEAQFGKLVREGAEAAAKQFFQKGAQEAAQDSAEAATATGLRSLARNSVAESTTTFAQKTASGLSDDVARAARQGDALVAPVVRQFGDEGAKALGKLSPANARRVGMMTDEIAATGKGTEFMQVLAAHGDVAAEWVWKHKGSLAAGTVAAAFLANPEPFLAQGGQVTTAVVKTAADSVAKPLLERTVAEMAATTRAVAPLVIHQLGWPALVLGGLVAWLGCVALAVGVWLAWRWNAGRLAFDLWKSWRSRATA